MIENITAIILRLIVLAAIHYLSGIDCTSEEKPRHHDHH